MALTVETPIINSPFEEPSRWWDYSEGQPVLREGRRPAGYYLRPRAAVKVIDMRGNEVIRVASLLEERSAR